jgi:hypothetical protein
MENETMKTPKIIQIRQSNILAPVSNGDLKQRKEKAIALAKATTENWFVWLVDDSMLMFWGTSQNKQGYAKRLLKSYASGGEYAFCRV